MDERDAKAEEEIVHKQAAAGIQARRRYHREGKKKLEERRQRSASPKPDGRQDVVSGLTRTASGFGLTITDAGRAALLKKAADAAEEVAIAAVRAASPPKPRAAAAAAAADDGVDAIDKAAVARRALERRGIRATISSTSSPKLGPRKSAAMMQRELRARPEKLRLTDPPKSTEEELGPEEEEEEEEEESSGPDLKTRFWAARYIQTRWRAVLARRRVSEARRRQVEVKEETEEHRKAREQRKREREEGQQAAKAEREERERKAKAEREERDRAAKAKMKEDKDKAMARKREVDKTFTLTVSKLEAHGLAPMDAKNGADPYVVFRYGSVELARTEDLKAALDGRVPMVRWPLTYCSRASSWQSA